MVAIPSPPGKLSTNPLPALSPDYLTRSLVSAHRALLLGALSCPGPRLGPHSQSPLLTLSPYPSHGMVIGVPFPRKSKPFGLRAVSAMPTAMAQHPALGIC